MLIEKINMMDHQASREEEEEDRPPSRVNNEQVDNNSNHGILKMSPRSQSLFFESLHKIYQEQDYAKLRCDFLEEPHSPEYTIVAAIDESCVLFQVKET